jgi:hypothetical protein
MTSPVTSARAGAPRDPLRDAQHQTAVDHHPQLGRHREQHLLLQLAEGHQHKPRPQLVPRQQRGNLLHLLLRGARQDGIAVKVHEEHGAAPPHHPIRRHGGVDAAREQARHAPAGPRRQAARARLLPEEIERLVREHLDVNAQGRLVEIDPPALLLFDPAADLTLDLR